MDKIHVTTGHTGKMYGIGSISTSRNLNPNCIERAKVEGSICSKCYAIRQLGVYKQLRNALEKNYKILTERILTDEELPILNYGYFRIESFGDLANTTQAINYLNIIKKNPQTFFGWWTKNPKYIDEALKGSKKPKNVNIIYSSMFINVRQEPTYDFIDKIFTVYDKDFIKDNKIKINCGAKSCLKCHKCYEKNRTKYINERLK